MRRHVTRSLETGTELVTDTLHTSLRGSGLNLLSSDGPVDESFNLLANCTSHEMTSLSSGYEKERSVRERWSREALPGALGTIAIPGQLASISPVVSQLIEIVK